jgi:hypothetical protein
MEKIFYIIALCSLVGATLVTGCQKQETPSAPPRPTTNAAPEAQSTNAPATNAPAH